MGHPALMYKIIGADQKEYGPVSAEQIRQWIAEGRVNGQTKVQAAGATEWKTVADFAEFAGLLPKTPPPSASTPSIPITPRPAPPRTNQTAVWAMVTGILSLLCCCGCAAPVAIVLGIVALSQLKNHPEQTGRGFAIAGIVLGIVALVVSAGFSVFYYLNPDFQDTLRKAMQQQ
jgi:hypothetical protein